MPPKGTKATKAKAKVVDPRVFLIEEAEESSSHSKTSRKR